MQKQDELDVEMILNGFDEAQAKKMVQAGQILKAVVNSQEFKDRVCSHHFYVNGNRKDGFEHCDLTGPEVYERFMSGVDRFNKDKDNDIDIWVSLYYSSGSVIGYTYPTTARTWLNKKYLRLWWNAPQKLAGNLGHEYCHNIDGIHYHKKGWHLTRKYTVPYAIGYLIAELGEQYASKDDMAGIEVGGRHLVCKPRFKYFPWVFKKCTWVDKSKVV